MTCVRGGLYLKKFLMIISILLISSCSSVNETSPLDELTVNDEAGSDIKQDIGLPDQDTPVVDINLNDSDSFVNEGKPDISIDADTYSDTDTAFGDDEQDEDIADNEKPDIDTVPVPCVDLCVAGDKSADGVCTLWDDTSKKWVDVIDDGAGNLHNRARNYLPLLRNRLMPLGGIFRSEFTDGTYTQVKMHTGRRDSPIWTGTYLASEAMRYLETGAPDAAAQIDKTVRVLDRWWRVSGNRGYLARYAAPVNSPKVVLDIVAYDSQHPIENHENTWFEGELWNWKGDISRDQYQGVMLGFSFAYEATKDEAVKEIIRSDVVNFIEQLMEVKNQTIDFNINGVAIPYAIDIQYAVYNDKENGENGRPSFSYDTNSGEQVSRGFLNFWTNPSEYVRQLPGFSWLPDFYLRTQAIQLAGMFRVALQVTDGVSAYSARRAAILQHYNDKFEDWRDMADGWSETNTCGASYFGLNIAFEPLYSWIRLEDDPLRKVRLQDDVLRAKLWTAVADHKNIFFAYIYASQANPTDNIGPVIAAHNEQLAQFSPAPVTAPSIDNTSKYSANPSCEGLSSTAIDVKDRVPSCFMWERNPWTLTDAGIPNFIYPGIDYLITYWMARHYGYIKDDAPNTCLRWK